MKTFRKGIEMYTLYAFSALHRNKKENEKLLLQFRVILLHKFIQKAKITFI